jgi:predicted nucleotidyltransferase
MSPELEALRRIILPLLQPYAARIRVFGSVARGEAGSNSDPDLLVQLKPGSERPPLGLRWFALEQELSAKVGRPVELITEAALSPHLRPYIEQDAVVLYEA